MDNDKSLKSSIFTRRALFMGFAKISLLSLLISRLSYLQITKSDSYKTLSENNSVKAIFLPAPRGIITDRDGKLLAGNRNKYSAMLEQNSELDTKYLVHKLCDLLFFDEEKRASLLKKVSIKTNAPILLYSPLTWDEVVKIETNSFDLAGIYVDVGQSRIYPYAGLCANVLGYVSVPSEDEIKERPVLKYQDVKIGKNGSEKFFDSSLIGEFGVKKVEVNAHGLHIRELSREDYIAGQNLPLSIDIELQVFISNTLNDYVGAVVVMDVENGEILAMNSTPSFDPNMITQGINGKEWAKLLNDDNTPLLNKAIANHYPPGSTFKLIVAAAALKQNISPDAYFYCTGHVMVGNRKFHCWKEHGHGHVNLTQAISQSCNCYFYNLAKQIGIDNICDMAAIFGFGIKSNIELPHEIAGLIPNKKWKIGNLRKPWNVGDTINCGIGQGFVLATPLQLAVAAARIASGNKVTPTIQLKGNENVVFEKLPIEEKYLQIIRSGMHKVVNDPMGTAFFSRLYDDEFHMVGKTGTSQVISKRHEKDDLSKKTTTWVNRNHGLFVGYAPYHQPKYACAIVIEHGGSGASDAAPVAKAIFKELKSRPKIT
jgi:penicillin-binding protein 2